MEDLEVEKATDEGAMMETLVEEEELMNLLFSFLEPNRTHSALLAGYFSKVVVCLMIRKTVPLMNYVQAHQDVFRQLVDLIGITSIMEVLVRLVGADDHVYPNFIDVMQWLAESNLLEMIVDKLSPSNPPEVHANAAETLSAITRNAPSALVSKLSSPSFVARIFDHALEDSPSKSGLVNSLSVCISLLDPKRSAASSSLFHSFRSQHMYESPIPVNPDTVTAMLPKLVGKFLQTDKHPLVTGDTNKPTSPAVGKSTPRAGNLGLMTRISNKLIQLGNSQSCVQACLQENSEWNEWQATVLQERNAVENVYRWACGRPTALQDRTRDSDDEEMTDRDYDAAELANNLSQAFRYKIYGNEDAGEDHGALDRDEEDVYFDDESAEVVISSLRLGDDHGSGLFTNSNWFAFQDDRIGNASMDASPSDMMDDVNLSGTGNGGNSSSDDEVVVGEDDELGGSRDSVNGTSSSSKDHLNEPSGSGSVSAGNLNPGVENASASHDMGFFRFESSDNEGLFGDRPLPEWVSWGESSDLQVGGASVNPFEDHNDSDVKSSTQPELVIPDTSLPSSGGESILTNGSPTTTNTSSEGSEGSDATQKTGSVPSLFEEDVEFVGMELEGMEKAMDQALKEGIVGEAGPLKKNITSKVEKENSDEDGPASKEFNDANYWRVDQKVAVLEKPTSSGYAIVYTNGKSICEKGVGGDRGVGVDEGEVAVAKYENVLESGATDQNSARKMFEENLELFEEDDCGGAERSARKEGAGEVQRGQHHRRPEEAGGGSDRNSIRIQKYTIYKDHITLKDYEIHDGMGL
ncbi:hypothetical protein ACLB2K_029699 [Fragaria x ananassa]